MKVAVTSTGTDLESRVDPRFGRARNFILVDSETGEFEVVDNKQNVNAAQGAGVQAAQNVAEAGAEAVVSGNVGPKAFEILAAAEIPVYLVDDCTVQEAVERFKRGELKKQETANVNGHW